ncbi:ABC transporter ATP-binding protein [Amycolatopsis sp. GM8]|uniref:ABC transporter ATP-binding protein n=1 Tax=Amycolatopsis sp. GM8 TaxID=2896530 RepID=UPI001F2A73B5|nr:ABC transporter ATP-binding protein [Amycolatopsis sp. GM8]
MTAGPVLEAREFSLRLHTREQSITIVDEVSWSVAPGETLAVVGESGSGKTVSTLGIFGLLPANVAADTGGQVLLRGRDVLNLVDAERAAILGSDVGVIFQDPLTAFNPMRRIGPQIAHSVRTHLGLDKANARQRAIELLAQVGIADPRARYSAYPHEMSGGMRQRALVALAIAGEPTVLIADEPTTALDVTTQAQLLELLREIQAERGLALVLITHDMGVVASMADKIAVMYAGRMVEYGDAISVLTDPDHPYTSGLLASIADPRAGAKEPFRVLPGLPPDLAGVGEGCRFADRCELAEASCADLFPVLAPLRTRPGGWQTSACWKHPRHEPLTEEETAVQS